VREVAFAHLLRVVSTRKTNSRHPLNAGALIRSDDYDAVCTAPFTSSLTLAVSGSV
jgi:hypothetical protein